MTTYGYIGLGHQGMPMAERMLAEGLRPWVWARRAEVLDRFRATDATIAASPAELGANCDVIGLCLFDADATESVLSGDDGLLAAIRPGTVLAIHSTVAPAYVRELADRVAPLGVHVVDAPVSGADAESAAKRELLVIFGGSDEDFDACTPMFATYAGRVVRVGPVGASQGTKLINNVLMTAITGLVFDAYDLGHALSIDEEGLAAVLASGSAANPSVTIYRQLGGAETFSVRAWPTLHKDVPLARSEADAAGLDLPLLVPTAERTIDEMVRRRAGWVAEHQSTTD